MFSDAALYPDTANAGEGTNKKIILFNSSTPRTLDTVCNFSTNTTQRYLQAKAGAINLTSATPAAGRDNGFNVLKTDMNNTSGTPNRRHILTGTWTFHCSLFGSTLDTSFIFTIKVYIHRRSSTGTLTELFNSESAAFAITAIEYNAAQNVTWTETGIAKQFLGVDETIQIEYWIQGRGGGVNGLAAQSLNFITGPGTDVISTAQAVNFVMPSNIFTEYARALSKTARGITTVRNLTSKSFIKTARGIVTLRKMISKFLKTAAKGTVSGSVGIPFQQIKPSGGSTGGESSSTFIK